MTDHVSEQLEQMTDNPRMVRAMRDTFHQLSKGVAGPDLAEMAEGVLKGDVPIRDLARTSAYGDALGAAFERYREWEAKLEPEERQRLMDETRKTLEGDPQGDKGTRR
ncbi:hypothetical protein [Actinoplanes sp. L3-i22]|uniref:hypothetical protein n=1 Tax=Actinoplanes sp. L3-i22 TaxID=2836373 RepID=UPI001C7513B5|nr:hypothetical protein [Actinoplanes sp. L3-i22]BCY08817.1 hypothetical protein L3i22_039050 [Actinoplanes sp. L3-i22]